MFTILYYRGCTKHVRYSRVNNGLVYPQILWTKGYVVYTALWFLLNKLLLLLLLCVLLVFTVDFHRTGAKERIKRSNPWCFWWWWWWMEDRETPRMHKYGESKTNRIMMATVRHVTAWAGGAKYQADGFLFDWVYSRRRDRKWRTTVVISTEDVYLRCCKKRREIESCGTE